VKRCHITLRGHWYDFVLNVHALAEDTNDDMRIVSTRKSVYSITS
jgi:hypothetical protein